MADESGTSIDDLTAEEHEILEYFLQNEQQGKPAQPGIPLCDRDVESPLSFGQLRMWLVHELNKEQSSPYDNLSFGLRIRGALNTEALQRSLAEIVRRHEVLRTTFVLKDDEPVQVVADAGLEPELELNDLSRLAETERECRVHELLQEAKDSLLDLATGPLFKPQLIRLASTDYVLVIIIHHIINDAWSNGIFIRELKILYECFDQGRPSPLQELPIQYRDFSQWQRDWLQGDRLKNYLDYWTEQLADLPVLELPLDRQRPPVQTFNGAVQTMPLSRELSVALADLSKNHGVTLFMTMLSALGLLLQRYGRQDDIGIGTAIANRDREELQGLIGLFLNMLVMRLDLSGDPSIADLLERVKRTAMSAYTHQHLPFEKLVEAMQLDRDSNRTPLFQISLTMLDAEEMRPFHIDNLEVSPIAASGHTARFDLEVYVFQSSADLSLNFTYNTDLFEAATIERMLGHYRTLLEGLVADPNRSISELPMLSAGEQQQFEDWNQTSTQYPADKTVSELFEMQAATTPDAIAVDYQGNMLSYGKLNQRANQLAHYLRARGVGPEVLVGLHLERSLEMIVSLLAILKAGGAYLPLDLDYPQTRIKFMLEDAGVPVLISLSTHSKGLPDFDGELLRLDSDWERIAKESTDNPASSAMADSLAYVIYTSGSTGEPKGVAVPHRALCNHMMWMQEAFPLTETDKVLQRTRFSFDASVWEFFAPLISGARLVMAQPKAHRDPRYLANMITEQQITRIQVVPSLLGLLLDEGLIEGCHSLRHVFCGGEVLSSELQKRFFACHRAELCNLYGPTEATIDATFWQCDRHSQLRIIPIGRPIANTHIYILDRHLQPVPIGVPGEMYIGGAGLARGYLNRPELTVERFIKHPFSDQPGARLYRTGDLARYLADGDIEFLGRIDHQVKLRGFRIELGEIESVLAGHEAVQDVAVVVREDEPGDERLVAYVVADEIHAPSVMDLRAFVRRKLPDYMLPSAFMVLGRLPLTANGKLDRRALPMPDGERQLGETFVEPRSDLERQLVEIWSGVLKLERLGIHDNFFDLGGHSLKATQVVSRIRGQLNVEMPLSQMFSCPTVAELAPVVGSLLDESSGDDADVISVVDRAGDLPLSFAQERLWFLHQLEPDSTAYNLPLAIRLKGELNVGALTDSLNAIVRRQEGLRSRFAMHQGKSIQIIEEATIELARHDLSALTSEPLEREVKAQVAEEALQPFDLSTGPLLRGRLLRLSDHEHVLLLTMHHIISDGWSLGVLFRELGACYTALSQGEKPVLAELPIQYADFAVWQREWLSGEVLASQMTYWQQKLKDLSTLNLPTDRSRPATQTHAGAFEALQLDAELSKQLTSLSKQAGATLFMTLLGAFAVLMHRYSGQDDVVIGSPIANRNRSEVEGLIGMFINLLVIRIQVSGNPGFRELLDQVQETALGAYQHQDIPFEKLVEVLQPTRDRSRNPLFQVQFVLQNAPLEPLELEGLTLEPVSSEIQVTRFDLECHVWESDDGHQVFFVYNTDLFNANSIRRMLEHYRKLLQSVVAEPDRNISELPMLSQHEQQQLIEWNQTSTDYPLDKTVHELFEGQVAATPDALAVDYEGDTLSYAQLNERANRLAHFLQARGVGPEVMVGLFMERSLEMIVGLLGILKAGGAYVPLDLGYPQPRIAFMLEDSAVPVLLIQAGLRERLPEYSGKLVCVDTDWPTIALESAANPESNASAGNLAYVIYTSGSTGQPKGVEIQHRAINRLVRNTDYFQVESTDRVVQASNISFDAATFELWGALLNGAQLIGVSKDVLLEPRLLASFLQQQRISAMFLTTALFNQIARKVPDAFSGLRGLMFGGEAVEPGAVCQVLTHSPPELLLHVYGPTESTTFASWYRVEGISNAATTVPIGRPLANTTLYILDKHRNPVPLGVPGELYIGGNGLARGYLNQPELTAEKFVANPFGASADERLYRTGDKVRYRYDGAIEFMGRFDHQVKLRGFRIELGEIETLLNQHEAVKDTIVMLREDRPGEKRLVAYIVEQQPTAGPDVLRQYVRNALPEYMLPSVFVTLDELPLSANGKVDRKLLPLPPRVQKHAKDLNNKPESEMEIIIAKIWEELLDIDDIETSDMFFDLGGHSLLTLKVVDRFAQETNIRIPPASLVGQTLRQLAAAAEASARVSDKGSGNGVLGKIKRKLTRRG